MPPAESKPKRTLQRAADECLAEVKATRKKKTHQAYSVALRYFAEMVGVELSRCGPNHVILLTESGSCLAEN